MGEGESAECGLNCIEAGQAHNIGSRQKENRGGCTCTLGEVQSGEEEVGVGQRSLSRVRVIEFATADWRDSSRSDLSLGVVENRFYVDVEGFHIAAHVGQAAYRFDGTV
jgi:hypothetical protein